MAPVCFWARGIFGCICISAKEMYFSASLLSYSSSVWGQFKAEMLYLLKMHAEQIHFPYCPAEQNGMWVREWLSPQHMCSHFMAWGRVCGAQKSYCCCREVPVRCPLSSIPSFSHSGSGLGLCCSGSCLYCCCCLGILPLSEWIRTSGGKGLWDD